VQRCQNEDRFYYHSQVGLAVGWGVPVEKVQTNFRSAAFLKRKLKGKTKVVP
jgi:hypothetical protein